MNELPQSGQRLLYLERAAEGPGRETRERIRRNIALALAADVGTAGSASGGATAPGPKATETRLGAAASSAGKVLLASVMVAVVGGLSLMSRGVQKPSARPRKAASAVVVGPTQTDTANDPRDSAADKPAPLPSKVAPEAAPSTEHTKRPAAGSSRPKPETAAARASSGNLRQEMRLLAIASSAIERGDLALARAQLARYRAQFKRGQLRQEERGLAVLMHCVANEPGAPTRAQRYLRRAGSSVLCERIASACAVKVQP